MKTALAPVPGGTGTMKLSELILAVGDENVVLQNLLRDASTIDKTKHGAKIAFHTDQMQAEELLGDGKPKKIGLVVWLPRDRVDAAISAHKAKATPPVPGGA